MEGLLGIALGTCRQLLGIELGTCRQLLGIELGMCGQLSLLVTVMQLIPNVEQLSMIS